MCVYGCRILGFVIRVCNKDLYLFPLHYMVLFGGNGNRTGSRLAYSAVKGLEVACVFMVVGF
jgi:hypothetical protein